MWAAWQSDRGSEGPLCPRAAPAGWKPPPAMGEHDSSQPWQQPCRVRPLALLLLHARQLTQQRGAVHWARTGAAAIRRCMPRTPATLPHRRLFGIGHKQHQPRCICERTGRGGGGSSHCLTQRSRGLQCHVCLLRHSGRPCMVAQCHAHLTWCRRQVCANLRCLSCKGCGYGCACCHPKPCCQGR
jgi:hypothetical protein